MDNPVKNSIHGHHCACSRVDGLFIPVRQLSLVIAAVVLLIALSFLGGYFLGKKHVVDDFVLKVEQDSFADQIYSSLCSLSDQDPDELRITANEEAGERVLLSQPVAELCISETAPQELAQHVEQPEMAAGHAESPDALAHEAIPDAKKFSAQLIGFGSESAAQAFVKRMQKKSISLEIKERESFTARGKRRVWYQVVTRSFEDKELLAKLIDRISKEEKIVGVRIVTA